MLGTIAMLLMAAASTPPAVRDGEDPDRVVCRASEPVLGSRVARRRLCRTVAEWRAFDADRAQMRRDLNAGNCNGSSTCSERLAQPTRQGFGPR